MQLIAHTFGGCVERMDEPERGPIDVTELITENNELVQLTYSRWMNRFDKVTSVSDNFVVTGVTNNGHVCTFSDGVKWWAVQYHPESLNAGDISVFRKFLE